MAPDPFACHPAGVDRFAGDRDRPGVGLDQADQDAQGSRLASAIRAEQADHVAFVDRQVEPIEGGNPAVAFA